jgi:hypothetical protein
METTHMNSFSMSILDPNEFPVTKGITHIIDTQRSGGSVVVAKDLLSKLNANGLAHLRRTDHQLRRKALTCPPVVPRS